MKRGKKGLELTISTLIIIVLSILILIALLVIWNRQTGIFSDFLKNISGKSNIDSLVTSCNSLQSQQSVYEYCCMEKEVKLSEEKDKLKLTCKELSERDFTGGRIQELNCENAGCLENEE